ncbi:HAMP domain-containing sensor histidine kinase [Streptococcus massiliensis]|uniref:histidine kinase n=1 Tax=Streptococcus massiliensis TaxID=313439 RepID=A0A380L4X7_9STRE|nr:HAMP domain-containing sensor histidine kinase [Streptococcus massiliensis]SUN77531.1 putative histidine kinase [Streptococcus massiliensis]
MKIVKKNFLLTASLIFLVVTSLLITLYVAMPIYYEQSKVREMGHEFTAVQKQLDRKSLSDMKKLLDGYHPKGSQLIFSLAGSDGNVLYPKVKISENTTEFQINISPSLVISENNRSKSLSKKITTKEGEKIILRAEYSLQPISDARHVLLQLYPLLLFSSLLLGSLGAYVYSRNSSRRIQSISKVARKMTTLDPNVVCNVKGNDEIADLAKDINYLYADLLTSMEALRLETEKAAESEREKAEFLRMTSHELKTPITGMIGMIDGMIYNVGDFKNRDLYLKRCRTILEEQTQLIQSILAVSKLEMKAELPMKEISVKALLDPQLDTYQIMAKSKNLHFHASLEDAVIFGNGDYFLKAVKNLLDNAFHYTIAGGEIRLSLNKNQLIVENQAERLLNDQQVERIFQPFYRPDYSRNRKDGGTGLGLFIVQQILEKHGLTYRFEAVEGKWMRFTIFFNHQQK